MTLKFLSFFILLTATVSFAQMAEVTNVSKRIYTTKPIGDLKAPEIDGLINEEVWDLVPWTGDYVENRPDENTPPIEQTKFKILYDKKNLYIALRCYDKDPQGIIKRMSRRDGFEGDWVEINIDSYNDKRTGFSFTISASGVKGDEFISENGNNWDGSWNPIWYVNTAIDNEGWTAEYKIPLSQLKFGKSKEQIWGLQSTRRYFRTEERSVWQRVPPNSPGWVSEFGELRGLIDLEPQNQLEIQPFAVAQAQTYPTEEDNPFRDGDDIKLNGGLDAKIGITNDLTLDLTVNPDFGQVEADPGAIALDGFQIFFQEQRPFFVENKNIFNFRFANGDDNIFYSRRIGRSPQGYPSTVAGEFVNQPVNTTILGAAKFSGKTKSGWSIGILESLTDKEFAEIDNNGERREELVEPLTNYVVGRAQKDFNDRNSYIGGIFTATNRNLEGNSVDFLRSAAYTGGFDFRHNWKNRTYYVSGNLVMSHVTGSNEAITRTQRELTHLFQREDAEHVSVDPDKTSLTGTGGKVEVGKAGSGNWRYNLGAIWRSPELELNDIGFIRQADEIRQFAYIGYQTLKPFAEFRKINANFNQFSTYDFEGNYNRIEYELSVYSEFQDNWSTNIGIVYKPRIFTNTFLQGGPRFHFSREFINYASFSTDLRKKLRFNGEVVTSQGKDESFLYTEFSMGIIYQPINPLTISFSPNFSRNLNKTQYVTQIPFGGETRYITADIDQRTLVSSLRVNYNINPNLTIQYYGQPFISRGTYKAFNVITNPVADYFEDRFTRYANHQISFDNMSGIYAIDENSDGTTDYTIDNPDFAFIQFRSNLVLRWEYIPGSEIFLVWSQGNTGFGNPRDDLFTGLDKQILGTQPENIFLIKATYRFVF